MAGSPIPFPSNSVPIVGQPFTFKSWFPTVQIVCNCEAKEPVLLIGNGAHECPACHRHFIVAKVEYDVQTGKLNIGVAIVSMQQEKHPS